MLITRISGVSDQIRLVRLGKIRLGVKALAKNGQTYPVEVDHFVVPPEVERVYGPKPKTLDIMFPVEDRELIFPQAYKWYGLGRGLLCIGDLTRAMRKNEAGQFVEQPCPCPRKDKECFMRGHLMVILPKVSFGGVYQIDTGAFNSIIDLNSSLIMVKAMIGRIAMVPLRLMRIPRVTFGGGHRRVHYPLVASLASNDVQWINRLRQTAEILDPPEYLLPPPVDENPEEDQEAPVVPEEELNRDSEPESAAPPAAEAPPASTVPAGPEEDPKPQEDRSRDNRDNRNRATEKQVTLLRKLASEKGAQLPDVSSLSREEASAAIKKLMAVPPSRKPDRLPPAEDVGY